MSNNRFSEVSDTELARRAVAARKALRAASVALQRAEDDLANIEAEADQRVIDAHQQDETQCGGCSACCDIHLALTLRIGEAEDFVRHLPA